MVLIKNDYVLEARGSKRPKKCGGVAEKFSEMLMRMYVGREGFLSIRKIHA